MPKVTYLQHDGTESTIELSIGSSLMQGAMLENIEGIEAECGGCCMCATCHVYVQEPHLAKLPEPEDIELEMLEETAAERRENSRLSCQLMMSEELDGVVLQLPETQI